VIDELPDWKRRFIGLLIRENVLRFGDFTLKSGRRSPFFFNMGVISNGVALREMGEAYGHAFQTHSLSCDVLFGPAYKGIPIATAMAIALASGKAPLNLPVAFNRKEAKSHGEGGVLIGAALVGDVLVVDDVVTDGAAKLESKAIIEGAGAKACGVLIALDRQEYLDGRRVTAAQALEDDHGLPVTSIVNLQEVIDYLGDPACGIGAALALRTTMIEYQREHCVI
jgi:orotate phosphoribosyltransferase